MVRAVLDTNVLVSALLWRGSPHEIFLKAMDGDFQIVLSSEIIEELKIILKRKKFHLTEEEIHSLMGIVSHVSEIINPKKHSLKLRDPEDLIITDCALSGGVDYIVTGDADLLSVGMVKKIKVVKPGDFLKEIIEKH